MRKNNKSLSTMERLKLHMDKNGNDYYKKVRKETKEILSKKK